MKKENLLFLLILATTIITRITTLIFPSADLKLFEVSVHHFWFGVIFLVLGLFVQRFRLWFFGIGLGLIIDQLTFILIGSGNDKDYWALPSLIGTSIILIIVYLLRGRIEKIIFRNFYIQNNL